MSELLDVLRTEKKYPVSRITVYKLCQVLRQTMPLDEYCTEPEGYMVRSLYFDSVDNRDFWEKEAGVECRRKIRLRTYGLDGPVKLECKMKQGTQQRKKSLLITHEDAVQMTTGDYQCLLRYDNPLAMELYTEMKTLLYRPCCCVRYNRLAFAVPINDTRITVDSSLCANEGDYRLLSGELPFYPVSAPGNATLEVKYNGFLPGYINEILSPFLVTEAAVSKYVASRHYGLGGTMI